MRKDDWKREEGRCGNKKRGSKRTYIIDYNILQFFSTRMGGTSPGKFVLQAGESLPWHIKNYMKLKL